MQYYSSAVCVLILLITTFTDVSESTVSTVKVKRHDSATLPCSDECSDLVKWTVFHKPTDVLAECDKSDCRSMKKGYDMSYEQCQSGNHSLIITNADYSMRGLYTCECGKSEICDVELQVEDTPEPEERTDNRRENEGPSHGGGQGGVSALVVVLVLVAVVVAGVGGRYWFRKRSQKSVIVLDKDEEKPMHSENASPEPNSRV